MTAAAIVALIGLLGIIITALGGYFVARRKTSGTISTTEAETLWAQNEKLLDRYEKIAAEAIAKAEMLDAENDELRKELNICRKERLTLEKEKAALIKKSDKSRGEE